MRQRQFGRDISGKRPFNRGRPVPRVGWVGWTAICKLRQRAKQSTNLLRSTTLKVRCQEIEHGQIRLIRSQRFHRCSMCSLTIRLSDVRRPKPKPIYLNHSTLLVLNAAATRCSNRLLVSQGASLRHELFWQAPEVLRNRRCGDRVMQRVCVAEKFSIAGRHIVGATN